MATRNSGRSEDRSNSRSGSTAGTSSGRRESTASAPSSGGSRQNSGASSGIGGVGSAGGASPSNTTNTSAGQQSRSANQSGSSTGGAQTSGANTSERADQERQLRTTREEGGARSSARAGGVGRSQQHQPQQQQQGRPFATSGYYGGGSPFAMMRRMMDDMDRLFSDFGLAQPGWTSSSFFGPELWSSIEGSRALGAGQSGNSDQQRASSGQSGQQQGLQRAGQGGGPQGWQHGLWSPEVEVRERGNNIVIRADLPGLSRDDVDVEIDDDNLIIRGERHDDWEDEQEGYYRSERSYGSFYRAIPLPEGVDPNTCNATFKDGVLEVTLPKPAETPSRGRKIQVK